ncbi:MAG: hypothetical protein IIT84_05270, partial [Oscillospiraceae bacterium]|nr:hypothetical protein [Oscillospiraceae bacterium]
MNASIGILTAAILLALAIRIVSPLPSADRPAGKRRRSGILRAFLCGFSLFSIIGAALPADGKPEAQKEAKPPASPAGSGSEAKPAAPAPGAVQPGFQPAPTPQQR